MSIFRKVIEFYKDPDYFSNIQKIALPIIVQQLMFSGLNMLGVILIGQKGDASVAAVGLAGQIAFLLNLVHFGIISGAAMFTAQFWGKHDIRKLAPRAWLVLDAGDFSKPYLFYTRTIVAITDITVFTQKIRS